MSNNDQPEQDAEFPDDDKLSTDAADTEQREDGDAEHDDAWPKPMRAMLPSCVTCGPRSNSACS